MRLKFQLFFTLLTASAALIVIMYAISSWSFSRGFLDYINRTQASTLSPIVDDLTAVYEKNGNWDWTAHDESQWHEVLQRHLEKPRYPGPRPPPELNVNRGSAPPKGPPNEVDKMQSGDLRAKAGPDELGKAQGGNLRFKGGPDELGKAQGGDSRLLLADENKHLLIGRTEYKEKVVWLPIRNNDGTVGFLGFKRLSQLSGQFDQAFESQQRHSFAYAALALIALSAVLSIPLAARVVKPLTTVSRVVSGISDGQYSHRVALSRNDELGDLVRDINKLAHSLEQNQSARRRWIAEISHELRTPVAIMQGEIESIQDGIRQADDNAINSLHSETLNLSRLIDDLHTLSLSDVGALDYNMQESNLEALILKQLDSKQRLFDEASIAVSFMNDASSSQINGDASRLEQLIANLIQNTLRYTEVGGHVRVQLDYLPKSNEVRLCWEDSHPGVDDASLPRLFDPLFRTEESRNRRTGGAGLGLAIIDRIVAAHGGRVRAEHSALGGLAIHIFLPHYSGVFA